MCGCEVATVEVSVREVHFLADGEKEVGKCQDSVKKVCARKRGSLKTSACQISPTKIRVIQCDV